MLVAVVVTALTFDFTNGFHDTANAVATSISTRAMPPRLAIAYSAIFNFAGAFISLKVATTIAKGIVSTHATTTTVVFAALVGAIAWNLITWWQGLPSSSSHALIGGLVGAAWVAHGTSAVLGGGILSKVVWPAIVSVTNSPRVRVRTASFQLVNRPVICSAITAHSLCQTPGTAMLLALRLARRPSSQPKIIEDTSSTS